SVQPVFFVFLIRHCLSFHAGEITRHHRPPSVGRGRASCGAGKARGFAFGWRFGAVDFGAGVLCAARIASSASMVLPIYQPSTSTFRVSTSFLPLVAPE